VINLRPAFEGPDFDERMVAVHLGLGYHELPIRGAQDLTRVDGAACTLVAGQERRGGARDRQGFWIDRACR
jgi:hypothetical protein